MTTKTRCVRIEPGSMANAVNEAARCLEHMGLVVAPTETRYGLLARADSPTALERLYAAKGRSAHVPTAIFASDVPAIGDYGLMTEPARRLAESLLPGPLTLVLESLARLTAPVVSGGKIGIRVSSEPFIESLARRCRFPVTATSANLSGYPDVFSPKDILAVLDDVIDLLVDGGRRDGAPSTVVDCTCTPIRVLREGAVSVAELARIAGEATLG